MMKQKKNSRQFKYVQNNFNITVIELIFVTNVFQKYRLRNFKYVIYNYEAHLDSLCKHPAP